MNGFWLHAIPSTIAAMLMIWLAWQSKQGRMKGHKRIAQAMLIFALIGLVGAVIYGITWTGFNIYFVHNALGFAALIAGISTFVFRKHCRIGYAAAGLAALALLTGVIAYAPIILGLFK